MSYDTSGTVASLAGIAVYLLSKFGISASVSDILAIVGGATTLYGIARQYLAHRRLATATGVRPE